MTMQITYQAVDIYRRAPDYVKSPFRYPGGKYYALRYIMPYINCVRHDEFREPFVGGGSIFFGKAKCPINWINDLESNLIITYHVIADDKLRAELARRIGREVATPERHEEVKAYVPASELEIAFKTFYLNRTSYSGIINNPAWGYKHEKSAPPTSWVKFIEDAGKKLRGVKITNLDFEEVVGAPPTGKTILFYLDPPYFHADQKRAYTRHFTEPDHLRLAAILRNMTNLFCLSYDDCREVRQLYSWAHIYEASWLYNTANKQGESRDKGNELVITNYPVTRNAQMSLF